MCGCGDGPPKRGSGGLCGGGGCPQWPDKCCLCFSRTGGVVITGILTILDNVCIILLCAYAIVDTDFWAEGYNILETWIFNNHWDTDVSKTVLDLLRQVNSHKTTVLSAFIAYSCLAIFNAMLLILGVCLQGKGTRRYLLLPWIVFDFVTISVTFLTFVTWAFLSFFVHVLVAIVFPILAGSVLGLHIYLWRNVKDVYFRYADQTRAAEKHVAAQVASHHHHHHGTVRGDPASHQHLVQTKMYSPLTNGQAPSPARA